MLNTVIHVEHLNKSYGTVRAVRDLSFTFRRHEAPADHSPGVAGAVYLPGRYRARAGTNGFVFSLSVLIIVSVFGVIPPGLSLLTPFAGFLAGVMFGAPGLLITSFVKSINHFNFFFTGLLSPMFFFSAVVFPLESLPPAIRPISEALPLTHPVPMTPAMVLGHENPLLWFDLVHIAVFIAVIGWIALVKLEKRLID